MINQQYIEKKKHREHQQTKQNYSADKQRVCPHCHEAISLSCEICPHCGKPVSDDHCTFCGATFEENERFCGECGSPREGITCKVCGTLSFRSFCCHCNAPLNDNAHMALQQAQADPRFQRAQKLSEEMANMEEYLVAFKNEIEKAMIEAEIDGGGPDVPSLSKEGEKLQAQYAELMKLIGNVKMPVNNAPATRPAVKRREQLKLKFADADAIMKAYQEKAAEMQATLKAMLPDPAATPQQQRDYACARKVAVISNRQARVPQYWVCNFCGCEHNQPSECCEPQLGGTWVYETVTISEKTWKYVE